MRDFPWDSPPIRTEIKIRLVHNPIAYWILRAHQFDITVRTCTYLRLATLDILKYIKCVRGGMTLRMPPPPPPPPADPLPNINCSLHGY